MKKYIAIVGILSLVMMLPLIAIAANTPEIYVNGSVVEGHSSPVVRDSRAWIPITVLSGALKLEGTLTVDAEGSNYRLKSSSNRFSVIEVDNEPYVSANEVADTLAMKLTRDRLTGSVYLFDRFSLPEADAEMPAHSVRVIEGVTGDDEVFNWRNPTVPDKIATISRIAANRGQVEITADAPLQPNLFQFTKPNRIVLDLPGSRLSTSMNGGQAGLSGEIATDHPSIGKIRYASFEGELPIVRIVIDLNEPIEAEVSKVETKVLLTIPNYDARRVVIDAGHGGSDPGSPGASKQDEKWYTLSLAKKVFALLEQEAGFEPILLRTDDTYSQPKDRAASANKMEADLFVSIHANSYKNASIRGTETYYYHAESIPFAEIMHEHVLEATGFPDRKVKRMNYVVIKETKMVSALLEIGYLSNPEEEAAMLDENRQNRVAAAIVEGIKAYYQLQ